VAGSAPSWAPTTPSSTPPASLRHAPAHVADYGAPASATRGMPAGARLVEGRWGGSTRPSRWPMCFGRRTPDERAQRAAPSAPAGRVGAGTRAPADGDRAPGACAAPRSTSRTRTRPGHGCDADGAPYRDHAAAMGAHLHPPAGRRCSMTRPATTCSRRRGCGREPLPDARRAGCARGLRVVSRPAHPVRGDPADT
jgi:hypothetical protein